MRRRKGDAGELLAAHAAGGLDADEAARVERHLAAHPEARAELDEIERTLAAVRAAAPRPSGEPDWDAMAREVRRACADQPAARRSWWRPALAVVAGAAAIALVVGALAGDDEPGSEPSLRATVAPTAPDRAHEDVDPGDEDPVPGDEDPVPGDEDPVPGEDGDLRAPVLADLSGDELERLELALDGRGAPEDAFVADLLRADPGAPMEPDAAEREPAHREPAHPGSAHDDDEAPGIDPFQPPDYLPIDEMADQMPDEAIEAIDRYLAEVHAG